jgi:hypothetical protein
LADTSINPATGLATDYLNRFNVAVMLLDMLSNCPEFRDDFPAWEPMSYREQLPSVAFPDPRFGDRRLRPGRSNVRNALDTLAATMTIVLEATRAAMDDADRRPETVCGTCRQRHRLAEAVDRAHWRDHQR